MRSIPASICMYDGLNHVTSGVRSRFGFSSPQLRPHLCSPPFSSCPPGAPHSGFLLHPPAAPPPASVVYVLFREIFCLMVWPMFLFNVGFSVLWYGFATVAPSFSLRTFLFVCFYLCCCRYAVRTCAFGQSPDGSCGRACSTKDLVEGSFYAPSVFFPVVFYSSSTHC